jgi:hypothetical protein
MNKKLIQNIIIFGGLGYLAYWLFKKQRKAINIDPKMGESIRPVKKEEPKTIVLDLREKNRGAIFPQSMAKKYDSRREKTFAPARTVIIDY